MKYICPGCGLDHDVPERRILEHIELSERFRSKVERLLCSIRGERCLSTMTPEERRERARVAVAAREAKRALKNLNKETTHE